MTRRIWNLSIERISFMFIIPCIVNQFQKNSNKMALLYSILLIPVSPSTCSDSSTMTAGHTLFINTRCCKYSLIELLMMGDCATRNTQRDLQELIKYCTRVSSCWNFFGRENKVTNITHDVRYIIINCRIQLSGRHPDYNVIAEGLY
jgi:hypothetical protein